MPRRARGLRGPLRLLALLALTSAAAGCELLRTPPPPAPDLASQGIAPLERRVSYERDVSPVLESRCVVCHGCYDAPCQLLLSSHEGALRGATKLPVYDSSRLESQEPTRLFIDAHSVAEWRDRGFFPVLHPDAGNDRAKPSEALLLAMLALGRADPVAEGERVPESVPLGVDRELTCAEPDEIDAYARDHPQGGMPYATAPLRTEELRILASWVGEGAPGPGPAAPLPARATAQVQEWEAFLNGASRKERITARYLYEHWFLAHLSFEDLPTGPFFRVVRSRTAPGEPIDEIATVRPYDDPGADPFWYRLRRIDEAIVHKTHIVYPLGPAKLERLRELFLDAAWEPARLPGYAAHEASNPFLTFDEIPARSRYAYLLDDAQYFVMTFIRGPVCRGQIAVDVIEDHFWISFLEPERDLAVIDPRFLDETAKLLSLPAEHRGLVIPGELWLSFNVEQSRYLDRRAELYDAVDPDRRGPALDWIWDGDGSNPNAYLTVFRNFDNATVVRGFVGEIPKTAWVMDYPIFERIYYDLVAGFNVFGDVAHQVSTRLYMDHLRMQSENLFLGFLPADRREAIRASWYRGATRQVEYTKTDRLRALSHGTQIPFTTDDPKRELLERILARAGDLAGPPDTLNRCETPPCDRADAGATERAVERELRRIASVRGGFVRLLPEVTFLRVRVAAARPGDLLYALVRNVAHSNVAFMFGEDERRLPKEDTLTVLRGHYGSYPNFFLEVEASEVAAFVDELRALRTDSDLEGFVDRRGVRRTSARFWEMVDWLHADLRLRSPREAGIYDLGRFGNL